MFFKTLLIGTMPKASPMPAQSVDKKFHIMHFTKIGAKVRIIANKKLETSVEVLGSDN